MKSKSPHSSPLRQAAFYVGYAEDLRIGFRNRSAHWCTIVVFGVKWCKTEVMPGIRLLHRLTRRFVPTDGSYPDDSYPDNLDVLYLRSFQIILFQTVRCSC